MGGGRGAGVGGEGRGIDADLLARWLGAENEGNNEIVRPVVSKYDLQYGDIIVFQILRIWM